MKKHSKYPPSSAYRWLKCSGSVLLPPDEVERDTTKADEGTLAHRIAELKLTADFWNDNEDELRECREDPLYSFEMEGPTAGYCSYVEDLETDTSRTFVETKVDMGNVMPGLFGTCDCIVFDETRGAIDIVDFKYGLWKVEFNNNPQLMLYALGAVEFVKGKFPGLNPEKLKIRMHIYQPRIYNVGFSETTYRGLKNWIKRNQSQIDKIVGQTVERNAGEWCRFCDRQIHCREYQNELMDCYVDDFFSLSDSEISENIDKLTEVEKLLKKLKAYAIQQAENGRSFPGYKLCEVNKRSWENEEAVKKIAAENELLSTPSPNQALKKLGKKKFEELLGSYLKVTPTKQLKKEKQ